jgi:uncharacterized membrane protein
VKLLIDGVDGMRRTRLAEWLVIWGLFAFLAATCALLALRPLLGWPAGAGGSSERRPLLVLAAGALVALACALVGQWTLAALALLLGAAGAALAVAATPASAFGAAVVVVGLLAATGVELVYVADFLQDTEWYRMNTVFKFYMQAWALLGCGVTTGLALRTPRGDRGGRGPGRALWLLALLVLLGAAGSFVVGGTWSRLQERFPGRPPGPTLDGMAFLDYNTFPWGPATPPAQVHFADDHAAYDWLLAHAHGFPIIATASTAPDPEGMFVATYTGLPVVVGSMHQEEQRYPDQVAARRADMTELYRTPDAVQAAALLRKYDVRYVYLGPYERALAAGAPAGLAKFAAMAPTLRVAFQHGDVTIYQTAGGP